MFSVCLMLGGGGSKEFLFFIFLMIVQLCDFALLLSMKGYTDQEVLL